MLNNKIVDFIDDITFISEEVYSWSIL